MSKVTIISSDDIRKMRGEEGLVLQGCGGDLDEWVDGINEMFTEEELLLDGTQFSKVSAFTHDNLTNLLFHFTDDVKLNMGKLAVWRIASHGNFGGTWLSDYVVNHLGGYDLSDFQKQIQRLERFSDTEFSFEFQCDITDGYPVHLVWNCDENKAWLSPNSSIGSKADYEKAMAACEKFGIRNCESAKDFNAILDSLGDDAKQCKIYEPTEDINLC